MYKFKAEWEDQKFLHHQYDHVSETATSQVIPGRSWRTKLKRSAPQFNHYRSKHDE